MSLMHNAAGLKQTPHWWHDDTGYTIRYNVCQALFHVAQFSLDDHVGMPNTGPCFAKIH